MLWNVNYGTLCMFVYHMHWDTFSLCYVSTGVYVRYLCSSWYHASIFFCGVWWRIMCCARPSQAQGYNASPPCGPVCMDVGRVWRSTMHPILPETIRSQGYVMFITDRSHSYIACVYVSNFNSWVTYWVFYKILKPHTNLISWVKVKILWTNEGEHWAGHGSQNRQ